MDFNNWQPLTFFLLGLRNEMMSVCDRYKKALLCGGKGGPEGEVLFFV